MDDKQKPGTSSIQLPIFVRSDADSDKESIPFADSPESQTETDVTKHSDQQYHDGIILLITSDAESQKSPNGSVKQHPLSDLFLLPVDSGDSSSHRRHSLQDRTSKKHYSPERKKSCPDAEFQLKVSRHRRPSSCLAPKSEQDISTVCRDRLTPTSFYSNGNNSRRASNCSLYQNRKSSTCSMGHQRRSSSCSVNHSRRSSNCSVSHSRRSSNCSAPHSRRSSNCSRRSSREESDEEYIHQHHHHKYHRGSRASIDQDMPQKYMRSPSTASVMSHHSRRASRMSTPLDKRVSEEDLEAGEIPPRHRRIIIIFIGSVSIFILVMSVVLIAVSLTLSPAIDDMVRKENEEIYQRAMVNLPTTVSPTTQSSSVANDSLNTSTPNPG